MTQTWTSDWAERIVARLSELGFASMHELVVARPSRTYYEIAAELGPKVAHVQVVALHFSQCRTRADLLDAAAESLARRLLEHLPDGWPSASKDGWFKVASAIASWTASLSTHATSFENADDEWLEIGLALRHNPDIPTGWIPASGKDPYIEEAFRTGLAARLS